jgi:hypothetical protein
VLLAWWLNYNGGMGAMVQLYWLNEGGLLAQFCNVDMVA